jgi:hypothetical protein
MATDHLKTPLARSLPAGVTAQIMDAVQLTGKALPCHVIAVEGALITVAFDVSGLYTLPTVTIPLFGPEYVRYPIKATDLGVVIPCDARLGYTSGQGGGIPDLSTPGNLESIFFMPLGNKNWVAVDPAQVTIYAPNGVTIRDTGSGATVVLHPTSIVATIGSTSVAMDGSSITMTAPSTVTLKVPSIVLDGQLSQGEGATAYNASLNGPLTVIGDVIAGGISLIDHVHVSSAPGTDTSAPVAGT